MKRKKSVNPKSSAGFSPNPSRSKRHSSFSVSIFRRNNGLKILSPAKLNLFLAVRSKRSDGYHDIETCFERIDLTDELTFRARKDGICVLCSSAEVPSGPQNLVYRAAFLLKEAGGVRQGVEIRIKKRIPVSAGLGGGSSNAAATLMGLNRFWKLGLSRAKLLALGARLGSDVPFFLLDASFATAAGRGEKLKVFRSFKTKIWHCLVKPPFGISTKEAYEAWDRLAGSVTNRKAICGRIRPQNPNGKTVGLCGGPSALTPQKANVKMLLHSIRKGRRDTLSKLLTNSLEAVLNKRVVTILKIKKALSAQGALGCLMSGSGSAVFGIYPSKNSALKAARVLKRVYPKWEVFAVSTL